MYESSDGTIGVDGSNKVKFPKKVEILVCMLTNYHPNITKKKKNTNKQKILTLII